MYKVRTKRIILTEEWLGWPAGIEKELVEGKADEMISRGVAKPVKKTPKANKISAPKNRAIQAK